eukprot:COSAG05_NODE_7025_length_865_cov_0.954308_1_plen_60_part_10
MARTTRASTRGGQAPPNLHNRASTAGGQPKVGKARMSTAGGVGGALPSKARMSTAGGVLP